MGFNLISGCHNCQEMVLHFRGEENVTMLPFYKRHKACMRMHPETVETRVDQLQEADWMRGDGSYRNWEHGLHSLRLSGKNNNALREAIDNHFEAEEVKEEAQAMVAHAKDSFDISPAEAYVIWAWYSEEYYCATWMSDSSKEQVAVAIAAFIEDNTTKGE